MTITFPRDFPFSGRIFAGGSDLTLQRGTVINQVGAGIQTLEIADPLWVGTFITVPIIASQRAAWQAWALSLRDGQNLFSAYHPLRQFPLAYGSGALALTRAGGGTWDGTATLAAVTTNTIGVTNLPANYAATVGDMISIPMASAQRSLHMIIEAATGDGAGALTVTVEPFIRSGAQIAATTVQLVRARCLMVLKPATFQAPEQASSGSVQFQGIQSLA